MSQKHSKPTRRQAVGADQPTAVWRMVALSLTALVLLLVLRSSQPAPEPPLLVPEPAEPLPTVQVLAPLEVPAEDREAQVMPWAQKLKDCTVTYYDVCLECCGKTDGITFSGALAVPYETCAVDPDVIPLGSTVVVDYGDGLLLHYRAEDVGGMVKGAHVDICVASHEEAVELGTRMATVYWTPPA